jgi:hypothetical protein
MPSSEYHRRQADTLLALALNTSNPELSTLYRSLAVEYKLLAEKGAADPPSVCPATPHRPAGEAEAGALGSTGNR